MVEGTFRIRIHGRGGQGIKTAGRVLGSAFFREGFHVQDAPRYGAERRGAPIFAYVRASSGPVHERGIIRNPDLVLVADDTLMQVPAAGVRLGLSDHTVMWVRSHTQAATWRSRLQVPGPTFAQAPDEAAVGRFVGAQCAGAAARLVGVIERGSLEAAVRDELEEAGEADLGCSLRLALGAFDAASQGAGAVRAGAAVDAVQSARPRWITLQPEGTDRSAPSIHGAATSVAVKTGLWRSMRPVIDHARCHRCSWMCALPCPDSAMTVDTQGFPQVDLDHCKGCLICVVQCPFHAIEAQPEQAFSSQARGEES